LFGSIENCTKTVFEVVGVEQVLVRIYRALIGDLMNLVGLSYMTGSCRAAMSAYLVTSMAALIVQMLNSSVGFHLSKLCPVPTINQGFWKNQSSLASSSTLRRLFVICYLCCLYLCFKFLFQSLCSDDQRVKRFHKTRGASRHRSAHFLLIDLAEANPLFGSDSEKPTLLPLGKQRR